MKKLPKIITYSLILLSLAFGAIGFVFTGKKDSLKEENSLNYSSQQDLGLPESSTFVTPSWSPPYGFDSGDGSYGFDSGDGSVAYPFIIKTPDQLAALAYWLNGGSDDLANSLKTKHYKLESNIDLVGKIWVPIGGRSDGVYDDNYFMGDFNGNGYTIKNMRIDENITASAEIGLFSAINGGKVYDLRLENPNISTGISYVGGITGWFGGNGVISQCAVIGGSIHGTNASASVGGLVGFNASTTYIYNSFSTSTIIKDGTSERVSGIIGNATTGGVIINIYNSFFMGEIIINNGQTVDNLANTNVSNIYSSYYYYKLTTVGVSSVWKGGYFTHAGGTQTVSENALKSTNMRTYFNNSSQQRTAVDDNWFFPLENFPVLRGVNNNFVAIKVGTNYLDISKADNNGGNDVTSIFSPLSSTVGNLSLSLNYNNDTKTWGSFSIYKKLGGTSTFSGGAISTTNNLDNNRIDTISQTYTKTITIPSQETIPSTELANRQGYFVISLNEVEKFYKHSISVVDFVPDYSEGIVNFEKIRDNAGNYIVPNVYLVEGADQAYQVNNDGINLGNPITKTSWIELNYINATNKYEIFLTPGARFKLWADVYNITLFDGTDSGYHRLFLEQQFPQGLISTKQGEVQSDYYFKAGASDNITVLMKYSDLYEVKFYNSQKGEVFSQTNSYNVKFEPKNRTYVKSTNGEIYQTDSDIYQITDSLNGIESYPTPFSEGYKFNGWFLDENSNNEKDESEELFSSDIEQNSETDSTRSQKIYNDNIRQLLISTKGTSTGVGSYITSFTTLYKLSPIWTKKTNTIEVRFLMNLGEDASWNNLNTATLASNYFNLNSNWLAYINYKYGTEDYKASGHENGSIINQNFNILTDTQVVFKFNADGYGYTLKGLIVSNRLERKEGELSFYDPEFALDEKRIKATFQNDYLPDSVYDVEIYNGIAPNKYFPTVSNQYSNNPSQEFLLNDIHNNLIIYVIYSRGEEGLTAEFSLSKPAGSETLPTGFEFDYDIIEVGSEINNPIEGKSGTISFAPSSLGAFDTARIIEDIRAYQSILITGYRINGNFYKISLPQIFTFTDSPNNHKIQYPQPWHLYDLMFNVLSGNGINLIGDEIVHMEIPIEFVGWVFNLKTAFINDNEEVQEIINPYSSQHPISDSDFIPTINVVPDLTDITGYYIFCTPGYSGFSVKANNVVPMTTMGIVFSSNKIWRPVSIDSLHPFKSVRIFTTINGERVDVTDDVLADNVSFTWSFTDNKYILTSFDDFEDESIYDVYFIMEKVPYTVTFKSNPNPNDDEIKLSIFKDGTTPINFNSPYIFHYDEAQYFKFNANYGYLLSDLTIKGQGQAVRVNNFVPEPIGAPYPDIFPNVLEDLFELFLYFFDDAESSFGTKINISSQNSQVEIFITTVAQDAIFTIEHYFQDIYDEELFEKILPSYPDQILTRKTDDIITNVLGYTATGFENQLNALVRIFVFGEEVEPPGRSHKVVWDGSLVFKFYYERNIYTLNYFANDGTGTVLQTQDYKHDEHITVTDSIPTRDGYTFGRWDTNPSGTGVSYSSGVVLETTNNINLYAIWDYLAFQVTWSALDADENSYLWENSSGYLISETQKIATSEVTYDQKYSYLEGVQYSSLINPSRLGYVFKGWWTEDGEIQIESDTTVKITTDTTFYAHWEENEVTIYFNHNLPTGAPYDLSFSSKTEKVNHYYGELPEFEEFGVTSALEFLGWSFTSSGDIELVSELTLIPLDSPLIINVYARWELKNPSFNTNPWSFVGTYTGSPQNTLVVSNVTGQPYFITNYFNFITYSYQWYKVDGGTSNLLYMKVSPILSLQNVLDSGQYFCNVTSVYDGVEKSADTAVGEVIINHSIINVTVAPSSLINGKINKTYDNTSIATGISTDNLSILEASAVYDTPEVGDNKTVTFTVTFTNETYTLANYAVYFSGSQATLTEIGINQYTFTVNNIGKINKQAVTINIGTLIWYYTATNASYDFSWDYLDEMTEQEIRYVRSHVITGSIQTTDSVVGTYTFGGTTLGLIANLLVKLASEDKSPNYNFSISGTIVISAAGTDKQLVVEKYESLNKTTMTENPSSIQKLIIKYNEVDISATNTYYFGINRITVTNNIGLTNAIIKTDPNFTGKIVIIGDYTTVSTEGIQTISAPYRWQNQPSGTLIGENQSVEFDFTQISQGQNLLIRAKFRNYAVLNYNNRLGSITQETVYYTDEGEEISHPVLSSSGLNFENWWVDTTYTQQAPAIWQDGVFEKTFFAKWSVNDIFITDFLSDGVSLGIIADVIIEKNYDGQIHQLQAVIGNIDNNLSYTYEWIRGLSLESENEIYTYKNVISKELVLRICAQLTYESDLAPSQEKQSLIDINITVNKYEFTYSDVISKVYDGNNKITDGTNDFIVVELNEISESFKIKGTYATNRVGEDIVLTVGIENNEAFDISNYEITITSSGTIIKKDIFLANIDSYDENNKIYDGEIFTAIKENVSSSDVAINDILNITIGTTSQNVGQYVTGEPTPTLIILSWNAFYGVENITNCYNLVSISGSAEILNFEINTENIIFNNETIPYDGQEHLINANLENFGESLAEDFTLSYSWSDGETIFVYEDGGPIDVGNYTMSLELILKTGVDPQSYSIIGANPVTATLTISVREITLHLNTVDQTFYGKGVKIVTVDTQVPTHSVVNLPLPTGYYIEGAIQTNSGLPGNYSQAIGNLESTLIVKNLTEQDVSDNFIITIEGTIKIIHQFNIVYNKGNENAIGTMPVHPVNYGQTITLYTNGFSNSGYVFNGWATEENGPKVYDQWQVVTLVDDEVGGIFYPAHGETLELFALWIEFGQAPIYVELYLQNLNGTYDSYYTRQEITGTCGYTVVLVPNYSEEPYIENFILRFYDGEPILENQVGADQSFSPSKEGFTLSHYEDSVFEAIIPTDKESGEKLKIFFERNSYKITFYPNNGDPNTYEQFYLFEETVTEDKIYSLVLHNLIMVEPTLEGHDFDGWFINYSEPNSEKINFETYIMPPNEEGIILTARYIPYANTIFKIELYRQETGGNYPEEIEESDSDNIMFTAGWTDANAMVEFVYSGEDIVDINIVITKDLNENEIIEPNETKVVSLTNLVNTLGFTIIEHEDQVINGTILFDPENPLVLKLFFERKQFTLIKNFHIVEVPNETATYYYGEEIILLDELPPTGFLFDGWWYNYTDGTYDEFCHGQITITNDTTINAKWKPCTDTQFNLKIYLQKLDSTYEDISPNVINFNPEGTTGFFAEYIYEEYEGVWGFSLVVYSGIDNTYPRLKTLRPFNSPHFIEFDISQPNDYNTIISPDGSGSITVYLKRNTYQINYYIYDELDPADVTFSEIMYYSNIEYTKPANPVKDGYLFDGWFFDTTYALNKKVQWSTYKITSDINIYAKWNRISVNWTLNTYFENPYEEDEYLTTSYTLASGGLISEIIDRDLPVQFVAIEDLDEDDTWEINVYENQTKTTLLRTVLISHIGYTFNYQEILTRGLVIEKTILADGSMEIDIYLSVNPYTLTINTYENDAPIITNIPLNYGQAPDPTPSDPIGERTGYTFGGWFTDALCTISFTFENWTMPDEDKSIYAKWYTQGPVTYQVIIHRQKADLDYAIESIYHSFTGGNYVVIEGSDSTWQWTIYTDSSKTPPSLFSQSFSEPGYTFDYRGQTLEADIIADLTINIYFLINSYTFTIVNEPEDYLIEPVEGVNYQEIEVYYNQNPYSTLYSTPNFSLYSNPVKTGYVFDGWWESYDDINGFLSPYDVLGFKMPSSDFTVYAKWDRGISYYTLLYYLQSATNDQIYTLNFEQTDYNSSVTENYMVIHDYNTDGTRELCVYESESAYLISPSNPLEVVLLVVEGYSFDYDYYVENYILDELEGELTADNLLTFNIFMSIDSYFLYGVQGNGQSDLSLQLKYGQAVDSEDVFADPIRTGYSFTQWFNDNDWTDAFGWDDFVMPAMNYYIYAGWMPISGTVFSIEYYLQNANGSYNATPFKTSQQTGTTEMSLEVNLSGELIINGNAPEALESFEGYSFDPTFDYQTGDLEGVIAGDGTTTLKVRYARNAYTLTIDYNDNDVTPNYVEEDVLFGSVFTETIPYLLRTGYDFKGWYYDEACTPENKAIYTINLLQPTLFDYIMLPKNVTLYAKWQPQTTTYQVYHVLEDLNGIYDDNNPVEIRTYSGMVGTNVTEENVTILTYLGFTFNDVESTLSGVVGPLGSLILYACYSRNAYNLVFDANGGSGSMDSQVYKYGETASLNSNTFTREGYNFLGWMEKASNFVVDYEDEGNYFFNYNENHTLFALWELNTPIATLSSLDLTVEYGDIITLTVNAPHNADVDYSFKWYRNDELFSIGTPGTFEFENLLNLTEIGQSGTYYVMVTFTTNETTGVANNTATITSNSLSPIISKRSVIVDFSIASEYIYNTAPQSPLFSIIYLGGNPSRLDISLPHLVATYFLSGIEVSSAISVGTYTLTVSLWDSINFEITGSDSCSFAIEQLSWDISSFLTEGFFFKIYPTIPDPSLSSTFIHPITGEQILINFVRETGENVGYYDLVIDSYNNPNYDIILLEENNGFQIIASSSITAQLSFVDPLLLTKIYDGEKVDLENIAFSIPNLELSYEGMFGVIESVEFTIVNNSKNVGSYEIILESCTCLIFENVELDQTYYFTITPAIINYVAIENISKTYDENNIFVAQSGVHYEGVLPFDDSKVTVFAFFDNANVGNNKALTFSLSLGGESSNYQLSSDFLIQVGSITVRHVKIVPTSPLNYIYGEFTTSSVISFNILGLNDGGNYNLNVNNSQFSGDIRIDLIVGFTKYIVGIYDIVSDLSVITSNYIIDNVSGGLVISDDEINPLQITIISRQLSITANWDKYYDGNNNVISLITLNGVLDGDVVTVVASYDSAEVGLRTITISLNGVDSVNYALAISTANGSIYNKNVTAILDYNFPTGSTHSIGAPTYLTFIYNRTIYESGIVSLPFPTATGYGFQGWFDTPSGTGNQFLVSTQIDALNWGVAEEKTLYARWAEGTVTLSVGAITKSLEFPHVVFDGENLTTIPSGTLEYSFNGTDFFILENITTEINMGETIYIRATNKANYEFDGWFASSEYGNDELTTIDNIVVNEELISILMVSNCSLFARFKLNTNNITLNFNADGESITLLGEFLNWDVVFENEKHSEISKYFDYNTNITLPSATSILRKGWTLLNWTTNDDGTGDSYDFNEEFNLSTDFVLYANWEVKTFTSTFVAATGPLEELVLINGDRGAFPTMGGDESFEQESFNINFAQTFTNIFAIIETPERLRFDFAGWFDSDGNEITSLTSFIWDENKTFYAKWTEQTFTAQITVNALDGGSVSIISTVGILSVLREVNEGQENITINLLASAILTLQIVSNEGYVLNFSNSLITDVDCLQTGNLNDNPSVVSISRFATNFELEILFGALLHEIQITVNDSTMGSVTPLIQNQIIESLQAEYEEYPQGFEERPSGTFENGIWTIFVFTSEKLDLTFTEEIGYEFKGFNASNEEIRYSFDELNKIITFENFITSSQIQINFAEEENFIRVRIGNDVSDINIDNTNMGSFTFSIDEGEIISGGNDYLIPIKTGQELTITVNSNYGYILSETGWYFNKTDENGNDGLFEKTGNQIIFSGFDCDGEILIPFTRELFTFELKFACYRDGVFDEITTGVEDYLNVTMTAADEVLENTYYFYERIVEINAVANLSNGYIFHGFFTQLSAANLIDLSTNNEHQVNENTIIYAVVKLVEYTVTYEINGVNGWFNLDSYSLKVKHGEDSILVTLTVELGFNFEGWEIYDEIIGWLSYPELLDHDDNELTRIERNVTQNLRIRANVSTTSVTITFDSKCIAYIDAGGVHYDEMTSAIGTIRDFEQTIPEGLITFEFDSETGSVVRLVASPNQGYRVYSYEISDENYRAIVNINPSLSYVEFSNFVGDFSVTVIFEAIENEFDIRLVNYDGDSFFSSTDYLVAGVIEVIPPRLQTGVLYAPSAFATVRTEESFRINFKVNHGFEIIDNGGVPKIGIRFDDETYVDITTGIDVQDGGVQYAYLISLFLDSLYQGGTIVLFLDPMEYEVTFHLSETEYHTFNLLVGSGFEEVLGDAEYSYYMQPSLDTRVFIGWFSEPFSGTQYINQNGTVIHNWIFGDGDIYAQWVREYATYSIVYNPQNYAHKDEQSVNFPRDPEIYFSSTETPTTITLKYFIGSAITLIAPEAAEGFMFSHWLLNGTTIASNRLLYQFFIETPEIETQVLTIIYKVKISVMPTVFGGYAKINNVNNAFLLEGESAQISATPLNGYVFVGWKILGEEDFVSSQPIMTVNYSSTPIVYVPVFDGKEIEILINNDPNKGAITEWNISRGGVVISPVQTGGKYYVKLDDVLTFVVTYYSPFWHSGWKINGNDVGQFSSYTVTVSDVNNPNITFETIYTEVNVSCSISFDKGQAEVTRGGVHINAGTIFSISLGEEVQFSFWAKPRWKYTGVTLNGIALNEEYIVRSENIYTVTVPISSLLITQRNAFILRFEMLKWIDVRLPFEGLGTEANPYVILTAEHLAQMSYLINNNIAVDSLEKSEYASAYYLLAASIDLSSRFWTPIGTEEHPFNGTLKIEYNVRNINLDDTYLITHLSGLFGYVTEDAEFKVDIPDFTIMYIILGSLGGALIIFATVFVIIIIIRRRRLREKAGEYNINME